MSTRDQQKAKYWPTAKAYAALDDTTEATLFERSILDEAMRQMRSWTPEEILEILQDAAPILATLRTPEVWCDWCDSPVIRPVRDGEEVSWRRGQARVWCSTACQTRRYEAEINAAGNAS